MDGFEEDFADADGAPDTLPGLGVLPTERTTFRTRLQFRGLPEIVRADLLCCCAAVLLCCCAAVLLCCCAAVLL